MQLQKPATNKIANFSNYFRLSEECKSKEPESSHEICHISDGCGCAKKKSPKELRVFQLRESDLAAFSAYAKKGILYAVVKDKNAGDGLVDLITNVDFASQVNLFLERHGYAAPKREDDAAKKADARAPQGNFSPQRGNGLPQERTTTEVKPSVKGRLAALKCAAQDVEPQLPNGRTPPKMRE